ncbi:MAG: hypothetical protein ACLPLP_06160 [Mycobacterium sp.]
MRILGIQFGQRDGRASGVWAGRSGRSTMSPPLSWAMMRGPRRLLLS